MYTDIHIRVIYIHSCMYITWRLREALKKREKAYANICIGIYKIWD